jgi:hypothetical protein
MPHYLGDKIMSHFENTAEEFPAFGGQRTKEQLADERAAQEQRDADKIEFLAEQKRIRDKESKIEDDRALLRAAEIDERVTVERFLSVNPNFDEREAKRLYREKLREIVAIERFRERYFGDNDKPKFGLTM